MWQPVRVLARSFTSFDTVVKDLTTGCFLVQGENLDDKGQGSNGSGKSSFVDIMPIVLIGESLAGRDLKNAINWNLSDKSFTVQGDFINQSTLQKISISRTIYNSVKPSELFITLDGVTPNTLPTKQGVDGAVDVRAGNEWILKEMLDISKEDLLNYYLVSEDNYTSFMKASNGDKLAVINRFSNGKLIDDVIKYSTDVELKSKQSVLNELIINITQQEAKIEALNETLQSSSKDKFEQEKKSSMVDLELQIKNSKTAAVKDEEALDLISLDYTLIARRLDEFELVSRIDERAKTRLELSAIDSKIVTLRSDRSIDLEIEVLSDKVNDALKDVQILREELSEADQLIHTLSMQLIGSLNCPKCGHEFYLDGECDHETVKQNLEELKELQEEITLNLEAAETRYAAAQEAKNQGMKSISKKQAKHQQAIDNAKLERDKLVDQLEAWRKDEQDSKNEHAEIQAELSIAKRKRDTAKQIADNSIRAIQALKVQLENVKALKYENTISTVKADIKKYQLQLQSASKSKDHAQQEVNLIQQWIDNFDDFKFFMANKPIESICALINQYLEDNDSELSVYIEGFKKLRNGKLKQELTPMVSRNGNMQPFNAYSGGEKVRVQLATDLAFQHIINTTSKTGGLNYYQNDELLNPLDSLGVVNAAQAFNNIDKVMMFATHSGADMNYPNVIKISKQKGFSVLL